MRYPVSRNKSSTERLIHEITFKGYLCSYYPSTLAAGLHFAILAETSTINIEQAADTSRYGPSNRPTCPSSDDPSRGKSPARARHLSHS